MKPHKASIVIPVRNHVALTERCLGAVFASTSTCDIEVIVVDDASTDDTAAMLAQDDRIRALRLSQNAGFATAANAGAAEASGMYLVFLNNDTEPQPGWLDALTGHADRHPEAAVVGSKCLFPDGTIQHAGVVICQDGSPRHLYAGFSGDHPAANRSRAFAAVTFASALVRRDAFTSVGGFDGAFLNGLEDVDLCLRLRDAGWQTRYCHESVVTHLERASRGHRSADAERNHRIFADRWAERLLPDDVQYYVADGLLDVGYADMYPIRLAASPELGILGQVGDDSELGRLLQQRGAQVGGLLREVARLTIALADRGDTVGEWEPSAGGPRSRSRSSPTSPVELLELDRKIERHLHALQSALAERAAGTEQAALPASDYLGYDALIRAVHDAVVATVPVGADVAVVSRGDDELVRFPRRRGMHLQRTARGTYLGHHPGDSAEAIGYLDEARRAGAEFLVVPSPSFWWLDHYHEFTDALYTVHECVHHDDACAIYRLESAPLASLEHRV